MTNIIKTNYVDLKNENSIFNIIYYTILLFYQKYNTIWFWIYENKKQIIGIDEIFRLCEIIDILILYVENKKKTINPPNLIESIEKKSKISYSNDKIIDYLENGKKEKCEDPKYDNFEINFEGNEFDFENKGIQELCKKIKVLNKFENHLNDIFFYEINLNFTI